MYKTYLPVFFILFALAGGFVIAWQGQINISLLSSLLIFIALAQGINIVYGFTGYLPFGYSGFFGAGAYSFAIGVMHLHLGAIPSLAIAACAALVLAALLTPLFRLTGAYFAIGSLAVALALLGIIENPALTDLTKGPYGVSIPQVFAPVFSYFTALIVMLFATSIALYLQYSHFGRCLRAMADDTDSAMMIGIRAPRLRAYAWLLSALVGGLAGGVFAWSSYTFFPETVFDINYTMFPLLFALAGGMRSALGVAVSTIVLYSLYNALGVNTQYASIVFAIAIILIMIFLPQGSAPIVKRWTSKAVGVIYQTMTRSMK